MRTIRDGLPWNNYEKEKGTYKLAEKTKKLLRAAEKYNLDVLAVISPEKNIYDDGTTKSDFLREADVEEYKNFLTSLLNEELVKNNVTKLEIMNEPATMFSVVDGVSYGTNDTGLAKKAEAYSRMVNATNDVVDSISDKNYKLGILSVTGIADDIAKTFANKTLSSLSKSDFDAISVHPYVVTTNQPEYNFLKGSVRSQADYYNNLAGISEPMWHTELGYSSAVGDDDVNLSVGDEYEQATMLIRVLDELKVDNPDDIAYIYEMSSDGTDPADREDNFEMVRSYMAEHPYSAKFSYLAVANYNSLTHNATEISRVESGSNWTGGNYITKYKLADRDVYLLRKTSGSGTTNYNFGSGNVYYYDLFGNKLSENEVKSGNGHKTSTAPYYVVVGTDITRAEAEEDTRMQADEFVIKGRIPSGSENSRISLTVTTEEAVLGETDFEEKTIFMDQSRTGVGGTFEFNIKVYETESIKAYIVTEDDEIIVLRFGITRDENGAITVTSGGVNADDINFSQLDLNNLSVSVDLDGAESDYKIVCAIYNDDKLVDVDILDKNENRNVEFSQTTDYDKLKVMVLKDLTTIVPLCEAYIKQ